MQIQNHPIPKAVLDSLEALRAASQSSGDLKPTTVKLTDGKRLRTLASSDGGIVVAAMLPDSSLPVSPAPLIDSCFIYPSGDIEKFTEYLELLQFDLSRISFYDFRDDSSESNASNDWFGLCFKKGLQTLAEKIDQWGEPPLEIELDWQAQSRAAQSIGLGHGLGHGLGSEKSSKTSTDSAPSARLTLVDSQGNLIPMWLLSGADSTLFSEITPHAADRFLATSSVETDTIRGALKTESLASSIKSTYASGASTTANADLNFLTQPAPGADAGQLSNQPVPKPSSPDQAAARTKRRLAIGAGVGVLTVAVVALSAWWFLFGRSPSERANGRLANSNTGNSTDSAPNSSELSSTGDSSQNLGAAEASEEMILLDTDLEGSLSADEASELLRSDISNQADSLATRLSGEGLSESLSLAPTLDRNNSAVASEKAAPELEPSEDSSMEVANAESSSVDISLEELQSDNTASQTVDATIQQAIAGNEKSIDVQQLDGSQTQYISKSIKLVNSKTDFKLKLTAPTSRNSGVCRVKWNLPEALSVEPADSIEITGEGGYEFLITKEIEDSKRLAKFPCQLRVIIESKPSKRWKLTASVVLEFPLQQQRIPISHQQSDFVFNQINNLSGAIQQRTSQLEFLKDASPMREVRSAAREQIRLLKRRAKEVDQALDAWTNAASLTNSFFDNEYLMLTIAPTDADLPAEQPSTGESNDSDDSSDSQNASNSSNDS